MNTTFHIQQRMNQRGINRAMIECVMNFGEIKNDKYILTKKMAANLIATVQKELAKRAKG